MKYILILLMFFLLSCDENEAAVDNEIEYTCVPGDSCQVLDTLYYTNSITSIQSLSTIPDCFYKLCNLEYVYFNQGIDWGNAPNNLNRLINLKFINASFNGDFINPNFYQFSNVKHLNFIHSYNLKYIDDEITRLNTIERLEIYECNSLVSITDKINELNQLKELIIFNTPISKLPKNITKCEKLEILISSLTRLNEIPNEIGELQNLKQIELYGVFETIPESFGYLKKIETVNLNSPFLKNIPNSFKHLSNTLQNLKIKRHNLNQNQINEIRSWFPNAEVDINDYN